MPSRTHLLQKQVYLSDLCIGIMLCCVAYITRLVVSIIHFSSFIFLFVYSIVGTDLKSVKFYLFLFV